MKWGNCAFLIVSSVPPIIIISMKPHLFILLIFLSITQAYSVPADGIARKVRQPDDTMLTLRLQGDEYLHYYLTEDNFIITDSIDGGFYYAIIHDGILTPSSFLAHDEGKRDGDEKIYLTGRLKDSIDANIFKEIREVHQHSLETANTRRHRVRNKLIGTPTTYIGKKKGLVILVDFPNQKMSSEAANTTYNRIFNEIGFSEDNHVGSVHDFFYDQSYGQFDLTFDVVGPLTVSKKYGYYGTDSMSGHNDMNVSEMIAEACELADEYVNYQDYDWDLDGVVDQVFIIYAGYGQATGGASNTIWPHEFYLANGPQLDNVTISQYACSNELYGSEGIEIKRMGIGTACHEFSHCLGLPDLYDTNYSGAFGMNCWSLMNSGSYNGPNGIGEVPCGYTAFERWFVGWLDFVDIDISQKIEKMPCLGNVPVCYRVVNEANNNEFYTFENRQPDKWFSYVSTYYGLHGMLVTHIDYDMKAWSINKVNPTLKHQRMSPIVADNNYGNSYDNLAGDLFPGKKNVCELTNTSHIKYGGKLFNHNVDGSYNMNISILNIMEEEGTISFDVIFNNEIPTPIAVEATNITDNSFQANWISNVNADSYSIELEVVKSTKPFVHEIILINDVFQTEYIVTDLDAEYCNYRVRANKGNLHTEWSNTIGVSLCDVCDICNLNGETILCESVYSLSGIKLFAPRRGNFYIKEGQKFIQK